MSAGLAMVAAMAWAGTARADEGSLYRGPAPRPGPDLLYANAPAAPQLTNAGAWKAAPILVSGASAYRNGEFLYQDYLYDDHGGHFARDSSDPRTGSDTFSQPNGTYTYPTDPAYADNAADLVELRVKPVAGATLFRLTLNTLKDPSKVAATIAIGTSATPMAFPHGANATAPAAMFLTVHGTTADLLDAVTKQPVGGGAPTATVDTTRRQIEVRVPTSAWNPGTSTVRLAAGVGLWDAASGAYLVPQGSTRSATQPGGASPGAPAFFNVAFRFAEPLPKASDPSDTSANPAWWRDRAQGEALRTGDLSSFHADVDFGNLAAGTDDESGVPATGVLNRIVASRYEPSQGTDFSKSCGQSTGCEGELRGQLQPYALYVPKKAPDGGRYGLQLLLHSLGAGFNQFSGSRNQSQFGDRGHGYLVMTPSGRGPDGWYYDHAGADTFEVWADVARHYKLDPALTSIAGYSMGGYGTFKFATQFPDLFAKGQPTVGPPGLGVWVPPSPPSPGGDQSNTYRQLASLRNIPFLIWNASSDELVPYAGARQQAQGFDDLGYRYEFDTFAPAEHLTLAVNDQFAPAAAFLGDATVDRDPAHVTYVRNPTMDFAGDGTAADHAYWLSGIGVRDGSGAAPLGTVDALSSGFGASDPAPGATETGGGSLDGGTFGSLAYTSQTKRWGPPSPGPLADAVKVTARNIGTVTVHPDRARLTCAARLTLDTDGPVKVVFAGCGRTETFAAAGTFTRAGGGACATAAGFRSVSVRGRGHGLHVTLSRRARRPVTVDVVRQSAGRLVLTSPRRVKRFAGRTRSFTWSGAGARAGYYTVRLRMKLSSGAVDERDVVLERRGGRFARRSASVRRPTCGSLRAFSLASPVFGGRNARRLRARYRLGRAAKVRVDLVRLGKVVRRVAKARTVAAGKTIRVSVRPAGLARATYGVRLTITAVGGRTTRSTLHARRL